MAYSMKPSVLPLLLLFVVLLPIAQVTLAGRPTWTTDPNSKKQQTQSTGLPNKQRQAEARPATKQQQTQSTGLPNRQQQQQQTQSTGLPNKQHEAEAHPSKRQQAETKPSSKGKQTVASPDKKERECVDHEGTVLIPGIGRYMIGSSPQLPTIGGTFLGDSVPAAMNGQYLPGNDDTFVPNPGYEVPNPFHGSVP